MEADNKIVLADLGEIRGQRPLLRRGSPLLREERPLEAAALAQAFGLHAEDVGG